MRDILEGEAEVLAVAEVIADVAPDVILLTAFDYDLDGHALAAFAGRVEAAGVAYPYRFAWEPNAGLATGMDLDGDGRLGTPRDAQGYGEFAGQAGMAILSRLPIDVAASRDFSAFRWADLPGAIAPEGTVAEQRLSSVGHWDVALELPDGRPVRLWAWYATPPVFDGPEDRNGRRNHDEAAFWLRYLEGALAVAPDNVPFVLMGDANLDPVDGDGRAEALREMLEHPRLIDPRSRSEGGVVAAARDGGVNTGQRGDPGLDTTDWPDGPGEPGNLRVDYVLPSVEWRVVGSGVWWPEDAPVRRRLVWADVELP